MRLKEIFYSAAILAVATGQVVTTSPAPSIAATPSPSPTPDISGSGAGGSPVATHPIPANTISPIDPHPGIGSPMPLPFRQVLPLEVDISNAGGLASFPFTIVVRNALGVDPSIVATSDGRGLLTHVSSAQTAPLADAVRALEGTSDLRPTYQQLFAEMPSCPTATVTRVSLANGPFSGNLDCYTDPRMEKLASAVAGIETALGLPQPRRKP